MSQLRGRESMA